MAKVNLHCDAIMCDTVLTIDVADWTCRNPDIDFGGESSFFFCKDHKLQSDWFDAVCPGCVESYPDCRMGKAFLYDSDRDMSAESLARIERGECPFRSNGTSTFVRGHFEPLDLSEQASPESGKAIADAIRKYIEAYPSRD